MLYNDLATLNKTQLPQNCPLVESLNEHKRATRPETTSLTAKIFAVLFPSTPAVNALLATLYISGPPSKSQSPTTQSLPYLTMHQTSSWHYAHPTSTPPHCQ